MFDITLPSIGNYDGACGQPVSFVFIFDLEKVWHS